MDRGSFGEKSGARELAPVGRVSRCANLSGKLAPPAGETPEVLPLSAVEFLTTIGGSHRCPGNVTA
jgi:hypothetical protein